MLATKPTTESLMTFSPKLFFNIGCIVMASGNSKRFGSNKLMTDYKGKPLISYGIRLTNQCFTDNKLLLTRNQDVSCYCNSIKFPHVLHNEPNRNDAIKLGLTDLLNKNKALRGCLFLNGDQPEVELSSILSMISAFNKEPDCIYRLSYEGIPGNPVLFPRPFFEELMSLPDKNGGSFIINQHLQQVRLISAKHSYELMDIDRPEDIDILISRT